MRRSWIASPVECLESRDMMSVIPIVLAQSHPITPPPTLQQISAKEAGGGGAGGGGSGAGGGGGSTSSPINQFVAPPAGSVPTPQELKREGFFFKFSGKYIIGPGRFENQSMTIYFKGVGNSSYFLHGGDQVGIAVDKDPSVPASGNSTSYDRNNNTNAAYSLDLIGVPGAVDKLGRPTEFTIATDVNASAGVFDQATSTGLLTIKYAPTLQHHRGYQEGNATVSITGLAYTLGTISNLSVLGSVNELDPNKIKF